MFISGHRYAIVGSRPPKSSLEEEKIHFERVLQHVRDFVNNLPQNAVIISGGASGVDETAAETARNRGLKVIEHLPDYKNYNGRMAPLIRNQLIVDDCDTLVAFPTPWSTGTWHAIRLATDGEKEVSVRNIEFVPLNK